jgi:hypothetical protein
MMTALAEAGQVGLTAIGESHAEADRFYRKTIEVLDREAKEALKFDTDLKAAI